jgi:hypothetical protein
MPGVPTSNRADRTLPRIARALVDFHTAARDNVPKGCFGSSLYSVNKLVPLAGLSTFTLIQPQIAEIQHLADYPPRT